MIVMMTVTVAVVNLATKMFAMALLVVTSTTSKTIPMLVALVQAKPAELEEERPPLDQKTFGASLKRAHWMWDLEIKQTAP